MHLGIEKEVFKQSFTRTTFPGTWSSAHDCITGGFQDAIEQGAK